MSSELFSILDHIFDLKFEELRKTEIKTKQQYQQLLLPLKKYLRSHPKQRVDVGKYEKTRDWSVLTSTLILFDTKLVKYLISRGANVNFKPSRSQDYNIPINYVFNILHNFDCGLYVDESEAEFFFLAYQKTFHLLLKKGADVKAHSPSNFLCRSSMLHYDHWYHKRQRNSKNYKKLPENYTSVMTALFQSLVAAGADINGKDDNGDTPLRTWCKNNFFIPGIFQLALDNKCDVNALEFDEFDDVIAREMNARRWDTSLHLFFNYFFLDEWHFKFDKRIEDIKKCLDVLLSFKECDVSIKNVKGQTPVDIAINEANYFFEHIYLYDNIKWFNWSHDIIGYEKERKKEMKKKADQCLWFFNRIMRHPSRKGLKFENSKINSNELKRAVIWKPNFDFFQICNLSICNLLNCHLSPKSTSPFLYSDVLRIIEKYL
jgi:ankyrin repeat protein